MNKTLIIIWICAFISILVFFIQKQIFTYKFEELRYKQSYTEWQMGNYERELIKFCQQISATATNTGWKYGSCVKQLGINIETTYRD